MQPRRSLRWREIHGAWASLFLAVERVGLMVEGFRSDGAADEKDAIVEGRRLALIKGEVQGWPLGLEPVRAQRVDGKKAIVAGVPVGWVVGVSGVVEDRNGFSLAVGGGARELAPLAARAPGIIADLAFAGAVDAGGAGGGSCDGGCYAVGIAEGLGLCGGRLEKVGDADAEQPVFVVVEDGGFEGFERDRHVDGAGGLAVDGELREDVARGLVEDGRLLVASDRWDVGGGVPGGLGDEFAGGGTAFGRDDTVVVDGAVFGAGLRLDRVGVVPIVDVVDVGVVEPEAGVVGMVGAFRSAERHVGK